MRSVDIVSESGRLVIGDILFALLGVDMKSRIVKASWKGRRCAYFGRIS